jgi:hypothetical protein
MNNLLVLAVGSAEDGGWTFTLNLFEIAGWVLGIGSVITLGLLFNKNWRLRFLAIPVAIALFFLHSWHDAQNKEMHPKLPMKLDSGLLNDSSKCLQEPMGRSFPSATP